MWFRYFVMFIDFVMCLCICFFMRNIDFKKDKFSVAGFSLMLFGYIASMFLMWR